MDNKYFVYALLDTRKLFNKYVDDVKIPYEPFYIGKGKGNRPYKHFKETIKDTINLYKYRIIQKILKETGEYPIVLKIKENLSDYDSSLYESEMIKLFGIKPDGILSNRTDGGSGGNTYKYLSTSELNIIRSKLSGEKNPMYGVERPIEWRSNHSEMMKGKLSGEKNPMYGVERPIEWRLNHSEMMKGKLSGEKNPMYGKKHTNETKQKISEKNKGKVSWNFGMSGIYSEETLNKMRKPRKRGNGKIPVYQYDLDMNLIKRWDSITEASLILGIKKTGIINCCSGRYSKSGGFIWKRDRIEIELIPTKDTNGDLNYE